MSRRHFQPQDIFNCKKLAVLTPKDTFSRETLSVETISVLRNFQPWGWKTLLALRKFQPPDTFSPEKLLALRNFQSWGWKTLSALRNFQPWDTFSPEKLSVLRNFQPRVEHGGATRQFQPQNAHSFGWIIWSNCAAYYMISKKKTQFWISMIFLAIKTVLNFLCKTKTTIMI